MKGGGPYGELSGVYSCMCVCVCVCATDGVCGSRVGGEWATNCQHIVTGGVIEWKGVAEWG